MKELSISQRRKGAKGMGILVVIVVVVVMVGLSGFQVIRFSSYQVVKFSDSVNLRYEGSLVSRYLGLNFGFVEEKNTTQRRRDAKEKSKTH